MLVVFDRDTGKVESYSGFRPAPGFPVTPRMVDSIFFPDGLPEGQAEYRIYDEAAIVEAFAHFDAGEQGTVVLDEAGRPAGLTWSPNAPIE